MRQDRHATGAQRVVGEAAFILAPWAKAGSGSDSRSHPLLCHLIDVAAVAEALWETVLGEGLRRRLATALGVAVD